MAAKSSISRKKKYFKISSLDKVEACEGVFLPGRSLRQHLYQRGNHKSLDDDDDDDYVDDMATKKVRTMMAMTKQMTITFITT